jgi:exonuclease VII small subunit
MIDTTKKPEPKQYGYEEPTYLDEGGWMLEGGEEAYDDALLLWEQAQQLINAKP